MDVEPRDAEERVEVGGESPCVVGRGGRDCGRGLQLSRRVGGLWSVYSTAARVGVMSTLKLWGSVDGLGVACVWGDPGLENSGAARLASASIAHCGTLLCPTNTNSRQEKTSTCIG
jgi:hypothetical protein